MTTQKLSIALPLPPSYNNAYSTDWKTKRRFVTPKYQAWKEEVLWKLKKTRSKFAQCSIQLFYFFPDLRRRDLGSFAKAPIDCLVEAKIIDDDNWGINPDLHLIAQLDASNPQLEIIVSHL